jgi:hypothetical protein
MPKKLIAMQKESLELWEKQEHENGGNKNRS